MTQLWDFVEPGTNRTASQLLLVLCRMVALGPALYIASNLLHYVLISFAPMPYIAIVALSAEFSSVFYVQVAQCGVLDVWPFVHIGHAAFSRRLDSHNITASQHAVGWHLHGHKFWIIRHCKCLEFSPIDSPFWGCLNALYAMLGNSSRVVREGT